MLGNLSDEIVFFENAESIQFVSTWDMFRLFPRHSLVVYLELAIKQYNNNILKFMFWLWHQTLEDYPWIWFQTRIFLDPSNFHRVIFMPFHVCHWENSISSKENKKERENERKKEREKNPLNETNTPHKHRHTIRPSLRSNKRSVLRFPNVNSFWAQKKKKIPKEITSIIPNQSQQYH